MRGLFIVIEGLDRSGKSSQSHALTDYFREKGFKTRRMCFPERTTDVGKMTDLFLRKQLKIPPQSAHLLFSANRWELQDSIKASLEAGEIIFCDRYYFSGCAYTSAAWGIDRDWCLQPEVGLIAPDLTLFFNVSPAVAAARGGYGAEIYETQEMQQKVRKAFEHFTATEPNWKEIDASGTLEDVFELAKAAVDSVVESGAREAPIRTVKY